jgi:hypothetical protein
MSLSVVPHAVGLTKHGFPTVAATATLHGIKPSAYLYPVSHIEQSILRRAGNMNICHVLSALEGYYWDTVRGILPNSVRGR